MAINLVRSRWLNTADCSATSDAVLRPLLCSLVELFTVDPHGGTSGLLSELCGRLKFRQDLGRVVLYTSSHGLVEVAHSKLTATQLL